MSPSDAAGSRLKLAEIDAIQEFWFDTPGEAVVSCDTADSPSVVSSIKTHWIEIALVDREGNPVPGEPYSIRLPNGEIITGSLNALGRARINGIDAGTAKITFPELDKTVWEPR